MPARVESEEILGSTRLFDILTADLDIDEWGLSALLTKDGAVHDFEVRDLCTKVGLDVEQGVYAFLKRDQEFTLRKLVRDAPLSALRQAVKAYLSMQIIHVLATSLDIDKPTLVQMLLEGIEFYEPFLRVLFSKAGLAERTSVYDFVDAERKAELEKLIREGSLNIVQTAIRSLRARQQAAELAEKQKAAKEQPAVAVPPPTPAPAPAPAPSRESPRVAVIYDTCYLMDGRRPFIHRALSPGHCRISNIVAVEVMEEIAQKIKGRGEEWQPASIARKRIFDLITKTDPNMPLCEEIRLAATVKPVEPGHCLGADSAQDRLQIAYGRHLIETKAYTAVIIATNDGGVQITVEKLKSESNLPLFCITDPHKRAEISPLEELLGFRVDWPRSRHTNRG